MYIDDNFYSIRSLITELNVCFDSFKAITYMDMAMISWSSIAKSIAKFISIFNQISIISHF